MKRSPVLAFGFAFVIVAACTHAAEQYPTKPVRLIVPYAPGGGSDITGRAIGQKLTGALGNTFVIDNRPGAASMIGTEIVARAPADGYTLILADVPHAINPSIYKQPRYDAVKDFAPISLLATAPMMLAANPSFGANTLKELLAMPKAQTEKFAFGSSGPGSAPHMTYELLHIKTGLTLNHVPYKGGGPAISDTVGGQIPLVFNAVPATIPFLQSKRIKGLGITSASRNALVPDVPTFVEAGIKDFVVIHWYGVLAPAGTPKEIIALLNREIAKALESTEIKERFAALALAPSANSPDDFRKLIEADVKRWKDVAAQTGVRLD